MEKQEKTIQFFRTEAIMERLEKGESTGTIIEHFEKEWGLSRRSLEGYIALAKYKLGELNKLHNAEINEVRKGAIAKVAENIVSDVELEVQLCAIAMGKVDVERKIVLANGTEKTYKTKPSHFEMILAIDKLWKKRKTYPDKNQKHDDSYPIMEYRLVCPEDIDYIEAV